jgi:hypothetical protein
MSDLLLGNGNYQFQIERVNGCNSVPLGSVQFSNPAADMFQYIDAKHSKTFGATMIDLPLGMGVDYTIYTTLTEASYLEATYTQFEFANFNALPSG